MSRDPLTPSSVNRNEILRRCEARISSFVGQLPELALERADRLLAGRVDELLVGLARLALVGGVGEAPGLDLAMERLGERRVLVERVLEAGREVDLGGLDRREVMEQLVRQRRRTVLDRTGQTVLAGHDAELAKDLEVELDLGDAAVGQRHAAVDVPVWTLTLEMPVRPGRRASSSRR